VATSSIAETEVETGTNPFSRWWGILTAPKRTFENIAKRPTWVFPLALLAVLLIVGTHYYTPQYLDRAVEHVLTHPDIPQEEKAAIVAEIDAEYTSTRSLVVSRTVMPIAITVVMYVVIAGAYFLCLNFLYGGSARFKSVFSVVAWSASVVMFLESVANAILRWAACDLQADFSLNLLGAAERGSFLYDVLYRFNAFNVWWIVLLSVGFAAAAKMKTSKTFASVITVFVFWWVLAIFLGQGLHFDLWSWVRSI
jgi:hypothetical protein